jgi:hypothetical protein
MPDGNGGVISGDTAARTAVEQERRSAFRKFTNAENRATDLERRMGINRWAKSDPEYLAALKFVGRRKFTLAVDQLAAAVVARLQELSKSGLRGTGA